MFNTNSFFRFYQCPEKKLTKKCTKPFCQYNHGNDDYGNNNNKDNNNEISIVPVVDYSQTSFGVDDFFSNLRPEDLDGYLPSSVSPSPSSSTLSSTSTSLLPNNDKTDSLKQNSINNFDYNVSSSTNLIKDCDKKNDHLKRKSDENKNDTKQQLKLNDNKISEQISVNRNNIKKVPKIKHYRDVMMERYAKIAALSAKDNNQSSEMQNNSKILLKNSSDKNNKIIKKPENETIKQLNWIPINVSSIKISFNIRIKNIKRIHEELSKLKSNKNEIDLCNEAKEIEKDICIRSKGFSNLYLSLVTSKIRSIRNNDDDDNDKTERVKIQTSIVNNMSIVRKRKISYTDLNETQLSTFFEKLILPNNLLLSYGFPILIENDNEPTNNNYAIFSQNEWDNRKQLSKTLTNYKENISIQCDRCTKTYKNPQTPIDGICVFHPKHAYHIKTNGRIERLYVCCNNEAGSIGCQSMDVHVTRGHQFLETRTGFVRTKCLPNEIPKAFALDCEMCYTESALEVCRVTIINFNGDIIYDKLIKPQTKIIDYATKYSGIKESDLINVTNTLNEIQNDILNLISSESFIVGHGLDSDFRALKLLHERVIDTAYLFPHKRGLPFKKSLKTLAVDHLNRIIQEDDIGHDSIEDAKAALDLVKLRLQDLVNKHNV